MSSRCRRAGFIGVCRCVFGIIRRRWVQWGAQWWSWGLSGVAGFIGVRHRVRLVHPESGAPCGSNRDRLVHSGAPWVSMGALRMVGFTRLRLGVVSVIRSRWDPSGVSWGSSG